jgi:hypothetical protein
MRDGSGHGNLLPRMLDVQTTLGPRLRGDDVDIFRVRGNDVGREPAITAIGGRQLSVIRNK